MASHAEALGVGGYVYIYIYIYIYMCIVIAQEDSRYLASPAGLGHAFLLNAAAVFNTIRLVQFDRCCENNQL